jgi:hypothetical protein
MAMRGRSQTNQKSLETVKRELEVVPEEILDAIADNGTRLVVINENEDPFSVIPTEGAPLLDNVDPKSYGPMLSEALTPILANVEDSVAQLDRIMPRVPDAQKPLVRQQRQQVLSAEIENRTNGLVSLLGDRQPTTLEAIARQHGASTSEEIIGFAAMVNEVSGPVRVEKSFNDAVEPSLASVFKELPEHQRPVQGHLLVPNLSYFEKDGERSLLHGPVANWAKMTANRAWAGYYRSDVNTVFLREEYLGETNEGTSTPVHEFGHAFGDLLAEKYPAVFQTFKAARDETFVELHSDPDKQFPTNYSSVNASEFVAETFAVRFDPDRELYPADGEKWQKTFEQALDYVIADRGKAD